MDTRHGMHARRLFEGIDTSSWDATKSVWLGLPPSSPDIQGFLLPSSYLGKIINQIAAAYHRRYFLPGDVEHFQSDTRAFILEKKLAGLDLKVRLDPTLPAAYVNVVVQHACRTVDPTFRRENGPSREIQYNAEQHPEPECDDWTNGSANKDLVQTLLGLLAEDEAFVVRCRLLEGRSFVDISNKFVSRYRAMGERLSPEAVGLWVHRVFHRALAKLRQGSSL